MSFDVDQAISQLEKGTDVPGTQLVRTLCSASILKQHGIEVPEGRESMVVWSLGVGVLLEPKLFFYGVTIQDVVERATKALKGSDRDNPCRRTNGATLRSRNPDGPVHREADVPKKASAKRRSSRGH